MRTIGTLWDAVFLRHETPAGHPEQPQRLLWAKEALDACSTVELVPVAPREATDEELLRVHSDVHLRRLSETAGRPFTHLDPDTPACAESNRVARLAAGGCVDLVSAALESKVDSGFAFPRPPGHHAERGRAMGFCLINNIAVAAAHATEAAGLDRVAIVDFDVHHGNGTQQAFYERRDVLYVSSHRYPFYPGTGMIGEIGEGEGEGYTVNLPMPAEAGDADFLAVYQEIVRPVLREFSPRLLLVSAGFDIEASDPLGGMRATAGGIGRLAALLHDAVGPECRTVYVLEGGYSRTGMRDCTLAVLAQLAGDIVSSPPAASGGDRLSLAVSKWLIPEMRDILGDYWRSLKAS